MPLSEEFLYELHERCDIVEIIGQSVALKKRGRNFVGRCPFHNEKTGSFTVYPGTKSFYCFGCQVGGDIITFVEREQNLGYVDAVKLLAERCGMTVPDATDDRLSKQRISILAANKAAARFFFEQLNSERGKAARAYLRSRELSDNTIRRFGLGYAPDDWTALAEHLHAANFYDADLIAANLCGKGRYGLYDVFRNRVMFPIIDLRGNIVAFGGRRLNEDDKQKYVNTSDTLVYKKSRQMYALNLAKSNTQRQLLLAEGYMDVISLHQAGFGNAVASLGTSLTAEQAHMMSQYADEVIICYDSDGPGQNATRRAIEELKPTGLLVRVLQMDDCKDPDEYIKKHGQLQFETLLERSENSVEYELNRALRQYDLSSDQGRVEYLKSAATQLARLDNPTETEIYAARLAEQTGVSRDAVLLQVESARKHRDAGRKKQQQRELVGNLTREYRGFKGERGDMGEFFDTQRLLATLCRNPDYCRAVAEKLPAEQIADDGMRSLYETLCRLCAQGSYSGYHSLSGQIDEYIFSQLSGWMAKMEGVNAAESDALFLAERIAQRHAQPDRNTIAESDPDELMKQLQNKSKRAGK